MDEPAVVERQALVVHEVLLEEDGLGAAHLSDGGGAFTGKSGIVEADVTSRERPCRRVGFEDGLPEPGS